jgi:hypothetical protein
MKTVRYFVTGLFLVTIVTFFICSTAHAAAVPDLSIWTNTWFKVKVTRTAYHFNDIGIKPQPAGPTSQSGGTGYLKITSWDSTPGSESLTAEVYEQDPDTGDWVPTPFATFPIYYFAGSDLKFVGSARIEIPDDVTMNLVFVFTGKRNKANTDFNIGGATKLSTIGSSMLEIDDVPGSTERWAGSVKISGAMVPVSKVPAAIR